jgi:hypothetical protein
MYSPAHNSEGPLAKGILLYVLQMTLNVLKKSSTMSFIGPVLHLFRGPFGKGDLTVCSADDLKCAEEIFDYVLHWSGAALTLEEPFAKGCCVCP